MVKFSISLSWVSVLFFVFSSGASAEDKCAEDIVYREKVRVTQELILARDYTSWDRWRLWMNHQSVKSHIDDALYAHCDDGERCSDEQILLAIELGLKKAMLSIKENAQVRRKGLTRGGVAALLFCGVNACLSNWVDPYILGTISFFIGYFASPLIDASMASWMEDKAADTRLHGYRIEGRDISMGSPRVLNRLRSYYFLVNSMLKQNLQASRTELSDPDIAVTMKLAFANQALRDYVHRKSDLDLNAASVAIAQAVVMLRLNFPDLFQAIFNGEDTLTSENGEEWFEAFKGHSDLPASLWEDLLRDTLQRVRNKDPEFRHENIKMGYAKVLALIFGGMLEVTRIEELARNGHPAIEAIADGAIRPELPPPPDGSSARP